ncbi:hypothetical protein [Pseudactinotalea sp. Z1732]|uniref:hypothetical protein n=1 Tax=Micrococcales TaxID=85006 RepID=UPI003C7E6D15
MSTTDDNPSVECTYNRAARALRTVPDPTDQPTVTMALQTIGFLLEHDEDGLAYDLFQDWATAVQERDERAGR